MSSISETTRDGVPAEIFCTVRNFNEVKPRIRNAIGDNGYALGAHSSGAIAGAPNPYIWPENLPRVNARSGPGGKPGCWQKITRQLWPAPLLVMDTVASVAPTTTSTSVRPSSPKASGAANWVTTPSTREHS